MRWRRPLVAISVAGAAAALGTMTATGGEPSMLVQPFGGAIDLAWPDESDLAAPAVAVAVTASGEGAWLAASDGGVFSTGDARYEGNTVELGLAAPVVDVAAHPGGTGYWLAAADGGVFGFGDAWFHGGLAGLPLAAPIVDIEPTPDGGGYWLLGEDGGVFAHGSARFVGSLPGQLAGTGPAVGVAASPTGRGYMVATSDGGIFTFGDAAFRGSLHGRLDEGDAVVDIDAHGDRYRLLTRSGRIATFSPSRIEDERMALPRSRDAAAFAVDPTRDRGWVVTAPEPTAFDIAFTGDVLPHISVIRAASDADPTSDRSYDFSPIFADVESLIADADLAICHLETTLSATDDDLSGYPNFRAPSTLADALVDAGYEGCSIASNHALDFGMGGLVTTLDQLDRVGLGHTGTARTAEEAATITTYDVAGVTVAHLSYSYGFNGRLLPPEAPWAANQIDGDRMRADAAEARRSGAHLVVVSIHWGAEYNPYPTSAQRVLAGELLASPDVDLIIGHHAHVVQPIERIDGKYVAYGLGNFLSGQNSPPRRDGIIVFAEVDVRDERPQITGITYQPTWVDRPTVIRTARPDNSLSDSWTRTRAAVELLGSDPTIEPR